MSHHFVPERPLDREDVKLAITWNYDFNNLTHFKITPDINVYYGLGKNYTVGFGGQIPFYVSHLTAIRYFDVDNDDAWAIYTHWNSLFGLNTNPAYEVGAQYSKEYGNVSQTFALGVAYGDRFPPPVVNASPEFVSRHHRKKFFPALRWLITGEDVGLSIYRYQGLSRDAKREMRELVETENDTLMSIPVDAIDSVSENTKYWSAAVIESTGMFTAWGIFLNDGTVLTFNHYPRYGDVSPMFIFMMVAPMKLSEDIYYFGSNPRSQVSVANEVALTTFMSANEVRQLISTSDTLRITSLSTKQPNSLPNRNWFLNDNSVAVSIFSHPKK